MQFNDSIFARIQFRKQLNNQFSIQCIPIRIKNNKIGLPVFLLSFSPKNNLHITYKDNCIQNQLTFQKAIQKYKIANIIAFKFNPFSFEYKIVKMIKDGITVFCVFGLQTDQKHNLDFGISYGFRIPLTEQLLIQFSSVYHKNQGVFKITIQTPKMSSSIPIVCPNTLKFQLYKILFVTCLCYTYKLISYLLNKSRKTKKKLLHQNYNRITTQKQLVSKLLNQSLNLSHQSKQNQLNTQGLIILLSYIGSKISIDKLSHKIINQINLNNQNINIRHLLGQVQNIKQQTQTIQDTYQCQLYQITNIIQAQVKGSQLFAYSAQKLKVNPCINNQQPYYLIILYSLRNKISFKRYRSDAIVNIGTYSKHYKKPLHLSIFDKIKNKFVN